MENKIILASASPRRHELLKMIFSEFSVVPSDIDETLPDDIETYQAAEYLAVKKAQDISRTYPENIVIGCDTVVILDNEILGKPYDEDDAFNMLRKLSGKSHDVVTGCCIFKNGKHISFSEKTEVVFYQLSDEKIKAYIETKEPMDKAGSYGIQSGGALFVKSICGDFYNVVGLPVARLNHIIENLPF